MLKRHRQQRPDLSLEEALGLAKKHFRARRIPLTRQHYLERVSLEIEKRKESLQQRRQRKLPEYREYWVLFWAKEGPGWEDDILVEVDMDRSVTLMTRAAVEREPRWPSLKQQHRRRRRPVLSLEDAIRIARKHLKDRRIDLSEHELEAVTLENKIHEMRLESPEWFLIWRKHWLGRGGDIYLRLHQDKSIRLNY